MFCACNFHGNSMNNLLLYRGLVDARISASEKDLPVCTILKFNFIFQDPLDAENPAKENENNEDTPKEELKCKECGRQCKSLKNFNNHMKYHKYVMSGEEVSCPECDKKYPQNFLKRHMKSAHENSQIDELDGNFFLSSKIILLSHLHSRLKCLGGVPVL